MQSASALTYYAWAMSDRCFADYAINNKLTPFISMQNHYSLLYREEEREMFPTLKVCTHTRAFLATLTSYMSPALRRRCYSMVSARTRTSHPTSEYRVEARWL